MLLLLCVGYNFDDFLNVSNADVKAALANISPEVILLLFLILLFIPELVGAANEGASHPPPYRFRCEKTDRMGSATRNSGLVT